MPSSSRHGGGARSRLIPLHPLTVGDMFDTAFTLLRGTWRQVGLAVVIVFGPLQLVSALRFVVFPASAFTTPGQEDLALTQADLTALAAVAVAGLVSFLLTPLVAGAVTVILARHDAGETLDWRGAYARAWGRYASLLGAAVLVIVLGIAGAVAAAVPVVVAAVVAGPLAIAAGIPLAVLLMVWFVMLAGLSYLVVPVVVLEDTGAWAAIRRVWGLVRQRFWPVLGVGVLAGILVMVINTAVGSIVTALAVMATLVGPLDWVVSGLGSLLGQVVSLPLAAALAFMIYVDLRIRLEGLDIELMAQAIEP